jgi:hypothetical protein
MYIYIRDFVDIHLEAMFKKSADMPINLPINRESFGEQ